MERMPDGTPIVDRTERAEDGRPILRAGRTVIPEAPIRWKGQPLAPGLPTIEYRAFLGELIGSAWWPDEHPAGPPHDIPRQLWLDDVRLVADFEKEIYFAELRDGRRLVGFSFRQVDAPAPPNPRQPELPLENAAEKLADKR